MLVDGDDAERMLLRRVLEADDRFALLAECRPDQQWPRTLARAGLVVVDPACDGVLDLRCLQALIVAAPRARVVIRSAALDLDLFQRASLLGIAGFLLKGPQPQRTLCDLLAVTARTGATVLGPIAAESLRRQRLGVSLLAGPATGPHLDDRESLVLRGLVEGCCRKEIAAASGLSLRTVQRVSDTLQAKLQVRSLCQLGAEAIRRDLL
ncbi:MAG TPA: LuxR C-terminal-related transcriptional regulator [Dehalococcoidia bacterium]